MKKNEKIESFLPLSSHENLAKFLKQWLCANTIRLTFKNGSLIQVEVLKPYIAEDLKTECQKYEDKAFKRDCDKAKRKALGDREHED